MATKILVYNGSDNGLLPDGTKPFSEPMLTQIIGIHTSVILQQM